MKWLKFSLLLLFTCFLAGSVSAQTNFIPKAGFNFSYFPGELSNANDEVKGETGFQIGFSVRFGEKLYFEPGLQYFNRNARLRRVGGVNVSDLEIDFEIEGLRIPLYLGADILEADRIGLRIFGGPTFMALFEDDSAFGEIQEYLLRNSLWSLNTGAGIDLGIFTVELEHEWGLTNVFETDGAESRNNVFYLTVGLLF